MLKGLEKRKLIEIEKKKWRMKKKKNRLRDIADGLGGLRLGDLRQRFLGLGGLG